MTATQRDIHKQATFIGVGMGIVATPGDQGPAGDHNTDGRVDGDDFLIWQRNFGA